MAVPVLQGCVGTSQPRLQFMDEQTSILTSDEIAQQLLRLSSTTFEIDCAQNGDDILKKKLGIVRSAVLQPLVSWT